MTNASPVAARLSRWTKVLGPRRSPLQAPSIPAVPSATRLVLVPPGSSLRAGIRVAEAAAREGLVVHLLARGASDEGLFAEHAWPAHLPLVCTELEAYLPSDKGPFCAPVSNGIQRWLSSAFAGAFPGIDAGPALQASAMHRLDLHDLLAAWPLARGIAEQHPGASVECVEPRWLGLGALVAAMQAAGGVVLTVAPGGSRAAWSTKLVGLTGAMWLAAAGRRMVAFGREATCRARLRTLREELPGSPTTWIGVVPDWPFSSRHLIEAASEGARRRGLSLGVLFQSSYQAGHREGAFGAQCDRTAVFPVLDVPALHGLVGAVDQCVAYESWLGLASGLVGAAGSSARVLARLVRLGPTCDAGPFEVSLHGEVRALSLLATQDVLRGREAAHAAQVFAARHGAVDRVIAWSHASRAVEACADLTLQRAGARTLELLHGALAENQDFLGQAHSNCNQVVYWTLAEAAYAQPWLDHHCVGGYPLRPPPLRPPTRRRPGANPRVLVLSNYGTYVGNVTSGVLPRVHYQHALFTALTEAVALTRESSGAPDLRWRPHPGDDRACIAETQRCFGAAKLSEGTSLQDDLAWADVVVASLSTTIVEALLAGVPVFVHDVPIHEEGVLMALFDDDRRFDDGPGLASKLGRCLDELRQGRGLGSEERLRTTFFGPSRAPLDVGDLLFPTSLQ